MLGHVIERARVLGIGKIALAVNKRNSNAIAAYEKWGFHIERSVVKDIGNGFVMDDFIMAKEV
jgi:ribosomal protein S18 acetylase RimI-like enzyme